MQPNRKKAVRVSTINRGGAPEDAPQGTRPRSEMDTPIARRFRSILRNLEAEYETETDRALMRQAATLALLAEQLQAQLVRGEPIVPDTISKLTGQLRRVLADLKRKAQARTPEQTPSLLAHITANDDADENPDEEGDD
jgi:hypothetical protein